MGLLHWSLGFLSIMLVFAWAQFARQTEKHLVHIMIQSQMKENSLEIYTKITQKAETAFPIQKTNNENSHPGRLGKKLYLSSLFTPQEQAHEAQKELFFKFVLNLYGSLPLFKKDGDNREEVRQLFEEALQYLIDNKRADKKTTIASFGNILFDGHNKDKKRYILFHILNGGTGEVYPRVSCSIPSLLAYISTDLHQRWADTYLAHPQVLLVLFEDKKVCQQIMEYRREIHKQIHNGANKQLLKEDFLKAFSSYLKADTLQHIGFSVSSTHPDKNRTVNR